MAKIIYILCTLTSMTCAGLLIRSYLQTHHRLLFWSGLSFTVLSIGNLLLLLDKTVFLTTVDLLAWRLVVGLAAVVSLLFGLIWEEK